MEPQNPNNLNPLNKPAQPDWLHRHQIAGYVFLAVIFAAVVSWMYFTDSYRRSVDTNFPVHQASNIEDIKDWKTYRNDEYGFEFKYHANLEVQQNKTDENSIEWRVGDINKREADAWLLFDFQIIAVKNQNQVEFISEYFSPNELPISFQKPLYNGTYIDADGLPGHYYVQSFPDQNKILLMGSHRQGYFESNGFKQILSSFKFTEPQKTTLKKVKEDQRYIHYEGEVIVSGTFQEILYPTIFGGMLCFYPDDKTAYLIPRENDSRIAWFCFSDQDLAKKKLGVNDDVEDVKCKMIRGEATIRIKDYLIDKAESEVVDSADLVEVIDNKGAKILKDGDPACELF